MDIILLTIGYPYPNRDVFVKNEIEIISKKFNTVWIIPVLEGVIFPKLNYIENIDYLPENVKICKIEYSLKDKIFLNTKIAKQSLYNIKFDIKSILKLLRNTFHANIVYNNLVNLIKNNNLDMGNTILYSYWFHFNALAISCIEENTLKVCRAHGYDLYKEISHQPYKNYIIENINYIYACSHRGKDYIQNEYGTNKVKTSYLGTFDKLLKNNLPNKNSIINIVSCSRVVDIKRIDKIIDALTLIENYNIKWTHIGNGPLMDDIVNYADRKLNNKNNISYEFLGNMSNEEVIKYYTNNNINIFLNVSYSEGLPVSIMEATSFGIPIIATDVGGTKEIVKNYVNGYLLDREFENNELSSYICKIIDMSEEEYKKICTNSRKIWEEKFNAEKNYNQFFEELISKMKILQQANTIN